MSRSEANKKRAKAIDTTFETTKEPEVKVEETKKEKKPFLKFKTTPAERMTKLATLNARTYIFLKGMGIVNKKLNAKVNGEVMPDGKPWFSDKSAAETKEEEKASPILNTVPTTTEVVKKDAQKKQEETKKTESTQQDSVKTKQPKEEKKDKEEPKVVEVKEDEIDYLVEPETEMEKVLRPKKNYRKNGKKARKAAMEAAKKSA